MRFRQIHMDFHTSELIKEVGSAFQEKNFVDNLKKACADSVTVFAKCHHGMCYYPTKVGKIHPHLSFDLLKAQLNAAKRAGIKANVYLSAGLDEYEARKHPEWLARDKEQKLFGASDSLLKPGFHDMCFNTGYLDKLAKEVEEVVSNYDFDVLFMDICKPKPCYCQSCLEDMCREGVDVFNGEETIKFFDKIFFVYTERIRQAADKQKKGIAIFHNCGNISHDDRRKVNVNSHLELESLPTGGWGYDHFPISAAYARTLDKEYLGMTAKFQKSWGDFGGFKSEDALKYENCLALAFGAKCSVGDQIAPNGKLDAATYALIGKSYGEVQKKEAWCEGYKGKADIAILSVEAADFHYATLDASNVGAARICLEEHYLFDIIDLESDFKRYKVLILPDKIRISAGVSEKLNSFLLAGGKILATGESGLAADAEHFAVDLGIRYCGKNEYRPDYFRPHFPLKRFENTAFVMHSQGEKVICESAQILGNRENPYFNRNAFHFCSHFQTPSDNQDAGGAMFENENGIYIAWSVFSDYAKNASLILKEMISFALNRMLGEQKTLQTNLPSQGIVTLTEKEDSRVLHLLYANINSRGESQPMIEDVVPLYHIETEIKIAGDVHSIKLVPQGESLSFVQEGDKIRFTVPKFHIHQMIEIK